MCPKYTEKMMKAAVLSGPDKLAVTEVPVACPPAGGIRVRVLRAAVPSFAIAALKCYLPHVPFPCVLGVACVGIVEKVGCEVTKSVKPGDFVICAPHIGKVPTGCIQGWLGFGTPESERWQKLYHDGSWAEYCSFPEQNVFPVPPSAAGLDKNLLASLGGLLISYGAVKTSGLHAGQTVLVGGATGGLGRGCVLLAIALGASKIYVMGRSADTLAPLAALSPTVAPIVIKGAPEDKATVAAAVGPAGVEIYLDAVAGGSADVTMAGLEALGCRGTAVLFGGVMSPFTLAYPSMVFKELTIKGSYMYDPEVDTPVVLSLITSGRLPLHGMAFQEFRLTEVMEAIMKARELGGNKFCVLNLE